MRPFVLKTLCTALVACSLVACNDNNDSTSANVMNPFNVAVFGDVPYGADQVEFKGMPSFIDSINNDKTIAFAMHGGDIHSGSEACTESYNRSVYDIFSKFSVPLIYTPGDNEWQDCNKKKQMGGEYNANTKQIDYVLDKSGQPVNYAKGDPIANLKLVRDIFFAKPQQSLGAAMAVTSQADQGMSASDKQFKENAWFMFNGVLFVTVNIPGGSNNGTDPWYNTPTASQAQLDEVKARTDATKNWLNQAFDQATKLNASAIVILTQADMWDLEKTATALSGYKPYVDIIATRTQQFTKPVLLLNGDSHVYRSDNPLVAKSACIIEQLDAPGNSQNCDKDAYTQQPSNYNVQNFHRVIFHGSTLPLEWLKLSINPAVNAANSTTAFGPFTWQRIEKK